ncbi:MAG TPA: methyltransferase domain-containing protein [Rhizomicrobium sp.]|jgi:SAM-dependent methyltransferase|nr:methyltransferase domain-containing protein [Rhizomicrobium sp.]
MQHYDSDTQHRPLPGRERMRIRDAWSAFWNDPASGLQCVRGAPDVTAALAAHWHGFASTLGGGARVLDLGCGAGAAARALVEARGDLSVTGIDFARVPPSPDRRIALISGRPMEQPGFGPAAFDAAVSQFGFEYGRTHRTARQLARILAPGAPFSFVVHHAGSSVVAANRARLELILAVTAPGMRAAFLAGSGFLLAARLDALRRAHPGDTLAAELARLLPLRARQGARDRALAWNALEEALAPERTILEALDACCVDPEELGGWLGPLGQFFAIAGVRVLRKANGDTIAWAVAGTRLEAAP